MTHRPTPRVEMLEPRRLLAAGGADLTFGTDGFAAADFAAGASAPPAAAVIDGAAAQQVYVQPDGRVIVAGTFAVNPPNPEDPAQDYRRIVLPVLARFLADGTPDPSFGLGGRTQAGPGRVVLDPRPIQAQNFPLLTVANLTPDAQGRLLVSVGGKRPAGSPAYAGGVGADYLFRLDPYGALDPTFAQGGILTAGAATVPAPAQDRPTPPDSPAPPTPPDPTATADYPVGASLPLVLPDGKLLVAAKLERENPYYVGNTVDFTDTTSRTDDTPTLSRLNPDGSIDQTFATAGLAVATRRFIKLDPVALLRAADGRIVLVSRAAFQQPDNQTGYDVVQSGIVVDVFDATGAALPGLTVRSFAGYGYNERDLGDYDAPNPRVLDATLDADGRLLLLADTGRRGGEYLVGRLNLAGPPNGTSPDGTPNTAAAVVAALPFAASRFVQEAGGGLLISGTSAGGLPVLRRLDAGGTLDLSLGEIVLSPVPAPTNVDGFNSELPIALGFDGSIVVGGTGGPNGASLTAARRWRDAGPLGQIQANEPITAANSVGGYRFQIVWRADDGIDVSSLDSSDLVVVSPAGSKRRAAFLGSATLADGRVVANYKIAPPNGLRWTADDAGRHVVRVLNGHVGDLGGDRVDGRYLGEFMVNLPAATRAAVPMGLARPASFLAFSSERIDPADPLDFGPHDEELLR